MTHRVALHARTAWPPLGWVGIWIVLYSGFHGAIWLFETLVFGEGHALWDLSEVIKIRKVLLAATAGIYALWRLGRFHPACSPGYAAWLKLTPWSPDRPLPCGPVHPTWQDAVVVGILAAIAHWHAHVNAALPAIGYVLAYLAGMTVLLVYTRQWKFCVVLGFLWPAMILRGAKGWPMVLLVAGIAGVVWHGYRASLRAFPWEFIRTPRRGHSILQRDLTIPLLASQLQTADVGWPLVSLSPKFRAPSVPSATGIWVSLLFGWWLYCIIARPGVNPYPEMILFFAIFAGLMRLAFYCGGVANSFNVWGRISSGRLFVPGYDQVFLTPLAAVLVALAGDILLRRTELSSAASISCLGAVVACILLCGGPSLRDWLLTGRHRYRCPSRLGTNKQLLRPI